MDTDIAKHRKEGTARVKANIRDVVGILGTTNVTVVLRDGTEVPTDMTFAEVEDHVRAAGAKSVETSTPKIIWEKTDGR